MPFRTRALGTKDGKKHYLLFWKSLFENWNCCLSFHCTTETKGNSRFVSLSWLFKTMTEPEFFWHAKNKYDRTATVQPSDSPCRLIPFADDSEEARRKRGKLFISAEPAQAPPMCDAFSLPLADKSNIIIPTIRIQWQHYRFHPSN